LQDVGIPYALNMVSEDGLLALALAHLLPLMSSAVLQDVLQDVVRRFYT
jgi:hypothetical protein